MRKSGILLHPTSLPGKWGIGDLGDSAYRFADFLVASGVQLWQVLPLGPSGSGYSPYQAYSSIAGNPLLISPELLVENGWLSSDDVREFPDFSDTAVDYEAVFPEKTRLIKKAAGNFFRREDPLRQDFLSFCSRTKPWLNTFAEFAALKEANSGLAWTEWKITTGVNVQTALEQQFMQFVFFRQWLALKRYCNDRGIEIIGDLPIFIAHDSADVWANPHLFDLDEKGNPKTIAGVPPDYFSKTGQCWGNPLYRWDVMEKDRYDWWIQRIKFMLDTVDIIRLDHYRGFEKYWEIPAGSTTAVNGRWVEGPGDRLFQAFLDSLGKLPFIAEDLGYITPEVHQLRDRWKLPGMRVLQFAFDSFPDNPHKPYNFIPNCVAYTGTHDNDTTAGWFAAEREHARAEQESALRYMGSNGIDAVWDFIRLVLSSVADTAIIPMQDLLGLGSEARMNTPATTDNNWRWRLRQNELRPELALKFRELNQMYGRLKV